MEQRQSVPQDSSLGYILKNWKKLALNSLKKKQLISFCNVDWPYYILGNEETWPIHGTLNYNTIRQLDLFCRREGKWTAIPYISAFIKLSQNPELRRLCHMCLATSLLTPSGESPQQDVLDDLALPGNLASVRGREITSPTPAEQSRPCPPPKLTSTIESPPDFPGSSPQPLAPKPPPYSRGSEPETTPLSTPNRNILLYPPLPKDNVISPIPQSSPLHTRSGLTYGDRAHLSPMREVPSSDGLARVHVPFSVTDLAQMKEKMGRYSDNHTKFIEGFKSLTLQFDLSWADLHIIISTYCTLDEIKWLWDLAVEIGDEKALAGTWAGVPGATAVPGQNPGWDYMNERDRLRRDHMIDSLLEAMQKGIRK
uniref:Core shell protein Gag P30 domain-containing protein n=1 Tax=Monodelphis domestica TaxID=13616 RepID=A0A5F8GZ90_MONDO